MHGLGYLSAGAAFGLKEFAMAYRNFNLIRIATELWESTAMGKQIEETHLEQVKIS
jgi:hypothetical protein